MTAGSSGGQLSRPELDSGNSCQTRSPASSQSEKKNSFSKIPPPQTRNNVQPISR